MKSLCGINNCTANHHKILHNNETTLNPKATIFKPVTILNCQDRSLRVLFKILPVNISGPKGVVRTFAFLDDGSNITLMNQDIADQIGASGNKSKLQLKWFGNMGSSEEAMVTDVTISGDFRKAKEFKISGVHVVPDLKLPSQTLDINKLHSKYHSMKRLPIQRFTNATPTILIGLDNAKLGITIKSRRYSECGPIVCLTKLGYVVYGPMETKPHHDASSDARVYFAETKDVNQDLHELVKLHFSTEEFGVKNTHTLKSKDEQRAYNLLDSTTKKINCRYESGLLWKADNPVLPNNLQMAIKRLEACERKMKKDVEYGAAYKRTISEYFAKGYAKVLTTTEVCNPKGPVWYLPHFGISNPNKSKFRLVFDAAAEYKGVSLNSNLLSGPDNNQPLIKY